MGYPVMRPKKSQVLFLPRGSPRNTTRQNESIKGAFVAALNLFCHTVRNTLFLSSPIPQHHHGLLFNPPLSRPHQAPTGVGPCGKTITPLPPSLTN